MRGPWRVWLFDLDKTLVNVEDGVDYCAARDALRERYPGLRAAVLPPVHFTRCAVEVLSLLEALQGAPDRWEEASEVVEEFELAGASRSVAMPGLRQVWALVAGRPVGVVTLVGPRAARAVVDRHGLQPACLVAREAGLRSKPAPDQVLRALRQLGAAPHEAVLVGDSSWDEHAAQAAGVAFVGIRWGRLQPGFSPYARVVEDLLEAAQLLLRAP